MLLFIVQQESDVRARVINIYHDTSRLSAEMIARGIVVDSLLSPTIQVGKDEVLYINPQTKEQWYEYIDRPTTFDERLIDVKDQLTLLKLIVFLIVPKWARSIAYVQHDIVRVGVNIYRCTVAHTSTDALKPPSANWTLIASA